MDGGRWKGTRRRSPANRELAPVLDHVRPDVSHVCQAAGHAVGRKGQAGSESKWVVLAEIRSQALERGQHRRGDDQRAPGVPKPWTALARSPAAPGGGLMPSYGSDSHAGNRRTRSRPRKGSAPAAKNSAPRGSEAMASTGASSAWASTAAANAWPGGGRNDALPRGLPQRPLEGRGSTPRPRGSVRFARPSIPPHSPKGPVRSNQACPHAYSLSLLARRPTWVDPLYESDPNTPARGQPGSGGPPGRSGPGRR